MPNAKGGKKFKKGKKQTFHEKALIYKDPKEDQEYGKVIRAICLLDHPIPETNDA